MESAAVFLTGPYDHDDDGDHRKKQQPQRSHYQNRILDRNHELVSYLSYPCQHHNRPHNDNAKPCQSGSSYSSKVTSETTENLNPTP